MKYNNHGYICFESNIHDSEMNLQRSAVKYERIAKTNFLIIKQEIHQMIGYFFSEIAIGDKGKIKFEKIPGCAKDHFGQW